MSELIQKHDNRATIRWKLLASASALALTAYVSSIGAVRAEDSDRPSIWLEFGGQWERQSGLGNLPVPAFVNDYPDSPAFSPISTSKLQRVPLFSEGAEASVSFQPDQSDWVFTAGIRYGRSSSSQKRRQGALATFHANITRYPNYNGYTPGGRYNWLVPDHHIALETVYENEGIQVSQSQQHTILDFSAGKDVGLGMLSQSATSTVAAGVRIAQFSSSSSSSIHARPDAHFSNPCNAHLAAYFAPIFPSYNLPFCFIRPTGYHTFASTSHIQRKFQGIGPSLSWTASIPVAGDPNGEVLTVDWGVNAAVLFGRQRIRGNYQTSGHYRTGIAGQHENYYASPHTIDRTRRVTVPNVGGLVGMSLKFPNAKVSIGYRGDFFFGALDDGIGTRKDGTPEFYGPFASISVGLGD